MPVIVIIALALSIFAVWKVCKKNYEKQSGSRKGEEPEKAPETKSETNE